MDWGKYLKYAAIGVAGYLLLARLGVFGEEYKKQPFIPVGHVMNATFGKHWTM